MLQKNLLEIGKGILSGIITIFPLTILEIKQRKEYSEWKEKKK